MGASVTTLRHTWASWQVQAETHFSHLQELGGWASFSMVQRYAHLSPGPQAVCRPDVAWTGAPDRNRHSRRRPRQGNS